MIDHLKDDIDMAIEELCEILWASNGDASAEDVAVGTAQERLHRAMAQAFMLGQRAARLGTPVIDLSEEPETDTEARGRMIELRPIAGVP